MTDAPGKSARIIAPGQALRLRNGIDKRPLNKAGWNIHHQRNS